jgi:hypothetical protein
MCTYPLVETTSAVNRQLLLDLVDGVEEVADHHKDNHFQSNEFIE